MKKGYVCDDVGCTTFAVFDDDKCGDGCGGGPGGGVQDLGVPYNQPPWYCQEANLNWNVKPTFKYKGLFRGHDVTSGTVETISEYNFIIRFDSAGDPKWQIGNVFRQQVPPFTKTNIDSYMLPRCNNACNNGTSEPIKIVSWNTGGGLSTFWNDQALEYFTKMLPFLIQLGYNGVTLDVEYIDPDSMTTGAIETFARAAKALKLHVCITTLGWGPQRAPLNWKDLNFDNIDLIIPQCYDGNGDNWNTPDTTPAKICQFWTAGEPRKGSDFIPCKVPPEKLAVGLGVPPVGSGPTSAYTEDVKKHAQAGYVIWGSLHEPSTADTEGTCLTFCPGNDPDCK